MSESPQAAELVARYKGNYGLAPEVSITEAMVLEHWDAERRLTGELRASTPETRADTFERCYAELYQTVSWLKDGSDQSRERSVGEAAALWQSLIGPPPQSVYEVGSGDGALARSLVALGYTVRATEITAERGDRREASGLTWGQTDGVHLDRFEPSGSFDAVISNQLVEHLHPDDLGTHLRSVRALLRPGGRFAFATPHAYTGPHDISRVFNLDRPEGMHLREYTYTELASALAEAGFSHNASPLRLPAKVRRRVGDRRAAVVSEAYLRYLMLLERPVSQLSGRQRRNAARRLRYALFAGNIMMVARAA